LKICPACQSSGAESKSWAGSGFDAVVGSETFRQPDFEIIECGTCGLLFKSPIPTAQEFADYYNEVDFKKWQPSNDPTAKVCFPIDRIVLSQLNTMQDGAAILDYGCSTGRLLAPLTKRFACYGFEINQMAAQAAADEGLHILTPQDIGSKSFELDCVVLVDVFEHLLSPVETLKELAALLKPGGKLVIATGNGDAPICRLDPAQFWYFRIIEHVCMLGRKHAEFLGTALNLALTGWVECSHYNTPLGERVYQVVRHLAYRRIAKGSAAIKKLIRFVPGIRRIGDWKYAPAVTYQNDHVVVVFEKPGGDFRADVTANHFMEKAGSIEI
jgi:SAM-dependent methyltransferase